jgi:hypothetical protein
MTYITPPVALVFIPTAAIVLLLSACFAGKLRGRLSPAQNCQHLAGALCVAVLVIGIGMSLYPGPLEPYWFVASDGTLVSPADLAPTSEWITTIGLLGFSVVALCCYLAAVYVTGRDLFQKRHQD